MLDHGVDVPALAVGAEICPPYETTVDAAFRDFWLSAFHSNDRVNVRRLYARLSVEKKRTWQWRGR